MSDEQIICVKCGRPFTWSYGEQRFYAEHKLHPPKRCPACRPTRSAKFDDQDPPGRARRAAPTQSQPGPNPTAVQIALLALLIVTALIILWWLFF